MSRWRRIADRYLGAGGAGSTERKVELLAIGLGLLLILQLVYSGISLATLSGPDAVLPSLEGVADAQPVPVDRVTAEQREAMGARPLFWTSRRPSIGSSETAAAAGKRGQLDKVRVMGVFGSGATAGAIVLVEDERQRMLLGEELQGWTLDAVHQDRVDFSRADRQETLHLVKGDIRTAALSPGAKNKNEAAGTQRREAARAERRKDRKERSLRRQDNENRKDNEKRGTSPARLGFGN